MNWQFVTSKRSPEYNYPQDSSNLSDVPAYTPVAIGGNPHELKRMVEREATTHEKSMMLVEN